MNDHVQPFYFLHLQKSRKNIDARMELEPQPSMAASVLYGFLFFDQFSKIRIDRYNILHQRSYGYKVTWDLSEHISP